MTEGIIIAIIGAVGAVISALIHLIKNKKAKESVRNEKKTNNKDIQIRNQKKCNNNITQIENQNNYTTLQLGDKLADNGKVIIDGGNASEDGKISYEAFSNENKSKK